MLRIMDVASALRRERETAETQLDIATQKQHLRERLLATAAAAGEAVTAAEVDAAIEQYFSRQHRYEDPPPSWRRFWAHVWVLRTACLTLLALAVVLPLAAMAAVGAFTGGPAPAPAPRAAPPAGQAPPPLPAPAAAEVPGLAAAWATFERTVAALEQLAADDDARQRVQAIRGRGAVAQAAGNLSDLQAAQRSLGELAARLEETYEVRIVSRPGEDSGVERRNAGRTSGLYVIVEALDAKGRAIVRAVRDAESGRQRDVRKWGEQIPEAVWNRIVADKQADGIVDEALFARKERGRHDEVVVLDDGTGKPLRRGRQITQW